jgi:hypothetical protein
MMDITKINVLLTKKTRFKSTLKLGALVYGWACCTFAWQIGASRFFDGALALHEKDDEHVDESPKNVDNDDPRERNDAFDGAEHQENRNPEKREHNAKRARPKCGSRSARHREKPERQKPFEADAIVASAIPAAAIAAIVARRIDAVLPKQARFGRLHVTFTLGETYLSATLSFSFARNPQQCPAFVVVRVVAIIVVIRIPFDAVSPCIVCARASSRIIYFFIYLSVAYDAYFIICLHMQRHRG